MDSLASSHKNTHIHVDANESTKRSAKCDNTDNKSTRNQISNSRKGREAFGEYLFRTIAQSAERAVFMHGPFVIIRAARRTPARRLSVSLVAVVFFGS